MKKYTLVINPGATSTKASIFEGETEVFTENISHPIDEIKKFKEVADQFGYRKDTILAMVKNHNVELSDIAVVMGRGGLTHPCESGIYRVNDLMKKECAEGIQGKHACNLGSLIADSIAMELGLECAYIADPVVVDERPAYAKLSGHPVFDLDPTYEGNTWHCLNQKMCAKLYAREQGKRYEDVNLIIAHMGGGVSVGCHAHGKTVEVNRALCGFGPFSPTRTGYISTNKLIDACFSGKYSKQDILTMITAEGGFVAYLGTNDAYKVELDAIAGDEKCKLLVDAFCYQVSQEICKCAAAVKGKVDGIILTGGIAYSKPWMAQITEQVEWIAPVKVYKGENEMLALAICGNEILEGKAEIKEFK
ncbi:MAG: butyrate kinase [Bacteroidales bacterium]|nr:butyrate kinase [Candidatus Colimorpha onthohippi]